MTKLKSKKMTKSTFAIIIMAIAMVAMLAFGGTYAYFTASAGAKQANMKMGKVSLKSDGTFEATTTKVVPGDTVLSNDVSYINESTVDSFIAVRFTAYYTGYVFDADGNTAEGTEAYHKYLSTAEDTTETLKVTVMKVNAKGEALNDDDKTEAEVKAADAEATFTQGIAGYLLHVTEYPLVGEDLAAFKNLTAAINTTNWMQGEGNYSNIYLMQANSKFAIAPEVLEDEDDEYTEVAFLNVTKGTTETTDDTPITFEANRHYIEGVWFDTEDGKLQWEDADVTISVEAYSIQAKNLTYDANGTAEGGDTTVAADIAASKENVGTVWEAMKVLLNIDAE